jgi:C4-dicarboxylate transporter
LRRVCFLDNDIILKLVACNLFSEAIRSLNLVESDLRVLSDAKYVFRNSRRIANIIAGKLPEFFVIITQQMTNEKTVVLICTAMGFAYVLKLTECDRHLTHLLVAPLHRGKWFLILGGIIAAYIVVVFCN